jgi:photosystem II stability/assembly factor-like uncharacterized protein
MSRKFKLALLACMMPVFHVAEASINVLERPAIKSQLAEKSVLIDLVKLEDHILAVGERGHIINWQAPGKWQQETVPVSVLLTAVTVLSDGTKVAVGHDSAIIVAQPGSDQWQKVFDGYQLLDLKVELFEKQAAELQAQIDTTDDEELAEELELKLEEITFGLEDTLVEKEEGPNKPLLSIAATSDDQLFVTGPYSTLLHSTDKGQSWQLLDDRLDNPDKFHLNSIISTDNDLLYIVGENSTAFISRDKGNSWERMVMPYEGSMFGINAQENTSNLIAYGLQGNLMVSNDAGNTWSLKRVETSGSFQGATITDEGRAYVVGHGGLVVDFDVNNIDELIIRKHPSGAAFAKPLVHNDELVLVGQYGIITWSLSNE